MGTIKGLKGPRGQVRELDEFAALREAEVVAVVAQTQERLERRRLEVQPTEKVELPDPPGEGAPGGPAVIPEPYPPPDEGNPPEPAIMPEPGPLAPQEPEEGRTGA